VIRMPLSRADVTGLALCVAIIIAMVVSCVVWGLPALWWSLGSAGVFITGVAILGYLKGRPVVRASPPARRSAEDAEFEAAPRNFTRLQGEDATKAAAPEEMLAELHAVRLATTGGRGAGPPTRRDGRGLGETVGIFQKRTGVDPVVGWLVCIKGTHKGRDYRLHSDLNKLGRAPNMDVCIEGDEAISRENHCQIAFSPRSKTFNIIPGDGRNLSYLNDQDVLSAMRLKAYDRLDLGESSFIFIPFEFDWATSVIHETTPNQPEPRPEPDEPTHSYPRPRAEPSVEGWGLVEPPPIRSVSTDAEALARIGPAAVAAVRQNSADAARTMNPVAPGAEPVDAAVFSPQRVAKDSVFLIQVFLYPPGAEDAVDDQARKMDAVAERRGTYSLPLDLPRNTRVDLRLEMPNLTVNEPDAILIWRGKPTAAQFEVTVPAAAPGTEAIGRIRFAVAGVPAGTLRFKIALAAAGSAVERGALRDVEAVRYRRAFASYSMQDRAEVLRRVQAFRIAGLSIFQDILDLEPGERWAQALYREIDKCDVFLLFWSSAAAASDWVAKEIAYALARKAGNEDQPPAIQPVPIEGPPPPLPPETLRHLHFNDALLAHIQAATTPRI
jgi:hypothetical protein